MLLNFIFLCKIYEHCLRALRFSRFCKIKQADSLVFLELAPIPFFLENWTARTDLGCSWLFISLNPSLLDCEWMLNSMEPSVPDSFEYLIQQTLLLSCWHSGFFYRFFYPNTIFDLTIGHYSSLTVNVE